MRHYTLKQAFPGFHGSFGWMWTSGLVPKIAIKDPLVTLPFLRLSTSRKSSQQLVLLQEKNKTKPTWISLRQLGPDPPPVWVSVVALISVELQRFKPVEDVALCTVGFWLSDVQSALNNCFAALLFLYRVRFQILFVLCKFSLLICSHIIKQRWESSSQQSGHLCESPVLANNNGSREGEIAP